MTRGALAGRECRNCFGDGWVRLGPTGNGRKVSCRGCGGSGRITDPEAAFEYIDRAR